MTAEKFKNMRAARAHLVDTLKALELAGYKPTDAALESVIRASKILHMDLKVLDLLLPPRAWFRVVAVSANTNSFGLRNYIFVAANGEAWSAAHSDGAFIRPKTGDDVMWERDENGRPRFEHSGYELVTRLPIPSAAALREIFP